MSGVRDVARASALALGLLAGASAATATSAAAAPEPTITAPAPGYLNNPLPTFQGTSNDSEDALTVKIYEGAGTGGPMAEELTALAGVSEGHWSAEATGFLSDGQYTAVAEQTQQTESEPVVGQSAPVTFTLDTVAPAPAMSTIAAFTDHPAPTLSGVGGVAPGDVPTVTVRIFAGSKASGTEAAGGSVAVSAGAWSYTPPPLADGRYTAEVEQSDEAGNQGTSEAQTFTVDTAAPKPETNPPPAYTSQRSPTLGGKLGTLAGDVAAAEVVVYQGHEAAGTVAAKGNAAISGSNWTYKPADLEDGTYTVQVTQRDQAGNEGESAPVTFTVDTVAPTVTIGTPPAVTRDRTPTLEGSAGTLEGDAGHVVLKLYKGTSATGTPYASLSIPLEGASWTGTLPSISQDGAYTAVVLQEDQAGNVGTSSTVTFTLDTKAPTVTVTAPKLAQVIHVSRPTFSGTAGTASGDAAAVALQIYEVGEGGKETKVQEIPALPVTAGGWSTGSEGPHLPDGLYAVLAEQADQAGNVGQSSRVLFTVETDSPTVTLAPSGFSSRAAAGLYSNARPEFGGTAQAGERDSASVTLRIYEGSAATGDPLQSQTVERSGGAWSAPALGPLADGTYTAQAEQTATGEEAGFSGPVTFTVDADAPAPSISSPASGASLPVGSVAASGGAGTAPGDGGLVTVEVFPGAAASGAPALSLTVPSAGGAWSAPLGGLAAGTYTALALQHDDVGNLGSSAPVTFSLSEPVPPAPPSASFTWFPAAPHVGEPVSLVSTSTDPASAIAGYSWSLAGDSSFTPGGQTISTAFTSPGNHVVGLSVIDQNGASSSVTEAIPVTAVPVVLMQPFPVVRIAGTEVAAGVRIRLLTVLAPVGAKVTIACRGRSCPARTVSALATAVKGRAAPGSATIAFHRFQRLLRPGTTLEIKVSKAGQIGKYVRFVARRGKLPTRLDKCLDQIGRPIDCPSS